MALLYESRASWCRSSAARQIPRMTQPFATFGSFSRYRVSVSTASSYAPVSARASPRWYCAPAYPGSRASAESNAEIASAYRSVAASESPLW